jgi:hypothetical protein
LAGATVLAMAMAMGCGRKRVITPVANQGPAGVSGKMAPLRPARVALAALDPGQAYVYDGKTTAAIKISEAEARTANWLVVDLGDSWAPFIFQDGDARPGDAPKPNDYRRTFVDLANDRVSPDGRGLGPGEHNFTEPFGIPPTLSVLRARVEDDLSPARQSCQARLDPQGLRAFTGNLGYLGREHARREHVEALRDAEWVNAEIARREAAVAAPPLAGNDAPRLGTGASPISATWKPGDRVGAIAALLADPSPKLRARVERTVRGQERLRAVRAAQSRLICDGLLSPRAHFTSGMFDLATHEALAEWERKNDIFGWGFLGGETLAFLLRPSLDLDFDTFRRVLSERVADAAGIVEDGSISGRIQSSTLTGVAGRGIGNAVTVGDTGAATRTEGATAADMEATAGSNSASGGTIAVPNLIGDHVTALLAAVHVATAAELVDFLRQHGSEGLAALRVAIRPPALPPYYRAPMDLSVEIDRGDVWYDFPFDPRGRLVEQPRTHYPRLTLFVKWGGQKIPLVKWRTTIGSWRSELHANGKIYYRYKNSDVGPRVWKTVVAGPVWVPPDATPVKDLLTRKVLDRNKGPEVVVNTEVMGPGFQSAYGLVMAIHTNQDGFDNQIRTHGSVDYTSIARRFSHGCHRLVNNRAVRLFDFVLRRQAFRRVGSVPLHLKRGFVVDGKSYEFELKTRGYTYELARPIAVTVGEGRVMGRVKAPIAAYIPKVGVDYSDAVEPSTSDSGATTTLRDPDEVVAVPTPASDP